MRAGFLKTIFACVLMLVQLGFVVFMTAGCATTDQESELSPRPWNSPKGWETGIPPALYERQR